ncbi:MAG: DUF932 domain-containing protein [Bacteroidia bacterium]
MLEVRNAHFPFPEYPVGLAQGYLKISKDEYQPLQGRRFVVRKGKQGLEIVGIVSSRFALVPNELVEAKVARIVKTHGLELLEIGYSKRGTALRIDLLSPKLAAIQPAVEKGDLVRFGFSIRNSIDGTTALAVDLLSYRLSCKNGATAAYVDFRYVARHVGEPSELIASSENALSEAITKAEPHMDKLADFYRKLTAIPFSEAIAQAILKLDLPAMYYSGLPLEIVRDEKDPKKISRIELLPNRLSAWDVFNHLTARLSHNSRTSLPHRSEITRRLHRMVQEAIGV